MNQLYSPRGEKSGEKKIQRASQRTEVLDLISIVSLFSGKPKALTYRSGVF